jgi:AraC-like DNA-binding protein
MKAELFCTARSESARALYPRDRAFLPARQEDPSPYRWREPKELDTNLTVSGIARTVHMSPHHFTLLFKQSTGQSPYRYVTETRARKAKELLTSGKFSISEIAHQVGFADQSHLTRHIKHLFGVTPKVLLEKRYLKRFLQ